ncbi:hypothetical protein WA026_007776 [Henosepilachna vigintioctopunctata]|uniref:Uncharacterized protein n=1 Tax=Henosepilachna vigintioctopunctata TaxID=420089 RepID=A0AAW1TUZ7_9CUCU
MDNSDMDECRVATNEDALSDHFFNRQIDDVDIGRESIPVLELSTSFGRESLGILKLGCDIDRSDYNISLNNITDFSPNVLNQAFLLPSHKASEFKSASTFSVISSNFSFNLKDLDQFSAISKLDYPYTPKPTDSVNELNNAFLYSTEVDSPSVYSCHSFRSLPAYSDREHAFYKEKLTQQAIKRVTEECEKVNVSISKNNSNEAENAYNDSVFLEAQYLSTKFSEGSSEDCILDETDPPALVSGDLEESECDHKSDKDEVFKKVDKLFPVDAYDNINAKLKNRSSEVSKNIQSPSVITNENINENLVNEDVRDSPDEKKTTSEKNSSDVEKSKEILNTLSHILSKNNRSEKEIEQGQHLLHTLSDMLSNTNTSKERSKSLTNISEKSSYGAGDMYGNSTNPAHISLQSSNSSKQNSGSMLLRRHSNSFSHPTKTVGITSFENKSSCDKSCKSIMSNVSEPSIEIKNIPLKNPTSNMRIKKMSSAPSKRGPMKATLPIDNLIKLKQKGTPQKLPKLNPKSSTPIRDVKIMPVAQSTPDNKIINFSSSSIEQTSVKSFGSSNLQEKSVATSVSGSSLSYKDSSLSKDLSLKRLQLPRRNSISESRRSSIPSLVRRSNSMKETTLMKTMSKIRMNITGSSALRDSSNIPAKDEESKISGKLNSSRKMIKPIGKENSATVY